MTEEDLCYLTAVEALALFKARKLSPVELLRALIARAERVEPAINAFGDRYFDQAMVAARQSERRWMAGEGRALDGIPVAVKDAQAIAGQRTTYGSPVLRDNVEPHSDPMIERLLGAGAVIHARTTTSEFCLSGICRSPMWGTTFNPWNRDYGPGGSSGGSGAALADGTTILATGTDMGGSIRVPASACGVVGYKPPFGRNPAPTPFNNDRFNHCGPLARNVADIALMQNVISGPHVLDHGTLRDIVRLPGSFDPIPGFRIAWSADLGYRLVDPDVRAAFMNALEVFRDLGCTVTEIELGWTEEIDRITERWFHTTQSGRAIRQYAQEFPHLVSPEIAEPALVAHPSIEDIHAVFDLTNRMQAVFGPIMERHDVFLCPTMTIPAVRADQQAIDAAFRIDGRPADPEFGYSMTHQFNVLQNHPVMSVPCGFAATGVPIGLQIVGRTFDDLSVFRAAAAFEAARGAWYGAAGPRPAL